ncbi:MAG: mannose-1-phosphate guanylyltransferase [Acidobacteriia bacterium]|nr:mannose-1-phosphate guanylyltransferase [Terriglobia bacterium]
MMYGVILAGGRGTRFWPKSRAVKPKQLQKILSSRTLLQETLDRISGLIPPQNVFVLGNKLLAPEIREQLPDVPSSQILAEPVGHNTAPCVGLVAHLIARSDPEAVLAVLPSDHLITKKNEFLNCLRAAETTSQKNENIVVLGIPPSRPETGYGYIHFDPADGESLLGTRVFSVKSFTEKPDRARAEEYVASKQYFWNGGIFVWKASTIIHAVERYLPKTHAALKEIAAAWGTEAFESALEKGYPLTDAVSLDYGIMEKAPHLFCVRADIGWNDLGSWQAVYEFSKKDAHENALSADCLTIDATGNLVEVSGKTVALVGVSDLVVVETEDALLICDRQRSQDVSRLVKELEIRKMKSLL